jgi:WD40 repeat protein
VVWHAHQGQVTGIAVSGDGHWVVSGGDDGTIWIQDREHPQAMSQGWHGQSLITSIAVSRDGRWVASGGDDGSVLIWNRENPKAAPLVLQGHETSVNGVALSREGQWLISGQGDGTLWIGTMSAADLQAKACKLAARNLSGAEWQLYLSDEPYRETCPGQPRPDSTDVTSKASTPSLQSGSAR